MKLLEILISRTVFNILRKVCFSPVMVTMVMMAADKHVESYWRHDIPVICIEYIYIRLLKPRTLVKGKLILSGTVNVYLCIKLHSVACDRSITRNRLKLNAYI